MNPMKRLGLAALLVVGVMLLASTPARGKPRGYVPDWGPIQLATGAEPQASGEAILTNVREIDVFLYTGRLTVECKNLTPGATYWTPAGTFTPNRKRDGKVSGDVWVDLGLEFDGWYWGPAHPYLVEVIRLDPDGSETTVLSGAFD